ncbi:MAG: NusG domain II-containing protein [Clostridia bacterium]|nr:NusG domain II-containing protein [Clostridia bacterium]
MSKKNAVETAEENSKRKIKNDIIFIVALILIVALGTLCYFLFGREGDMVKVTIDGELFGEYSLSEDNVIEIRWGESFNILVIENGKARIESASCPDGICVSHRAISRSGESIICLPNKVVVSVSFSDEKNQPDIIA